MWEMPFYDILLLYRTLEEDVKNEEERQKKEQEEYESKMPSMPDYKNFAFNMDQQMKSFNMDSIAKGYGSMPSIPSLPSMPSMPSMF